MVKHQVNVSPSLSLVTTPDGFVNFNSIALYDELYGWIMAVVVFMATIQFLKLLQFNKKMGMLGSTVSHVTPHLHRDKIVFNS